MATLNIKNKFYYFILLLLMVHCGEKEKDNVDIPLYHFNEEILFVGYSPDDIDTAKVFFLKGNVSLNGSIEYTPINKSETFGRIQFESISDTIRKNDTICILIDSQKHFITEIVQKYVKVSIGNERPGIIDYKLDGKKYRESEAIITKQ